MYKDFFHFLLEHFAEPVALVTGARGKPFTLYAQQGELWVKNAKQNSRRLGQKDVEAFIARFEETESRVPGDYQDVTFHASYLLAAMKYLDEKSRPAGSVIRFHSEENNASEEDYFAWLASHPLGYVLNLRKESEGKANVTADRFTCLHAARCSSINEASGAVHPRPFTGNQHFKVCADSLDELESAALRITMLPEIRRCSRCLP